VDMEIQTMDFARAIYVSTSSWALSAVDRLSFETADGPGPTEGGGVDKLVWCVANS